MTSSTPPSETKSLGTVLGQLLLMAAFAGGAYGAVAHFILSGGGRHPTPIVVVPATPTGVAARDRAWPTSNPSPRTVDLFQGLKLSSAIVSGSWEARDGAPAVSDEGQATRFDFGYRPSAEYDLRFTFARLTGNDGIDTVFAVNGRQIVWTMAGWDNTTSGFSEVMAGLANENPTTVVRPRWFRNGQRYTCLIQVRQGAVRVFLDGQPVDGWATDYDDMAMTTRTLSRADTIGLSTWESSYAIYSAEAVEVSGAGGRVTPADPLAAVPIAVCEYDVVNHPPAQWTVYSNGHIKAPQEEWVWFRRGDTWYVRWGPFVDRLKLSADRKSFAGRSPRGEPVTGHFISGGL